MPAKTAVILKAAKKAGVEHVVRLSAIGVDPKGTFPLSRLHGAADSAVMESGLGWTILRPTFFMDNILKFHADEIRSQGVLHGAAGEGRTSYASSADIAGVAVEALTDPPAHRDKIYVLTGAEAITDDDLASLASNVLGRPVRYQDVGLEAFAESLRAMGQPEWIVESMVAPRLQSVVVTPLIYHRTLRLFWVMPQKPIGLFFRETRRSSVESATGNAAARPYPN